MQYVATIISRVFDPFLMLAVIFFVLLFDSKMFFPALITMVIFPFVLCIFAWKTKIISNWDITDRRQRPKVLWTIVVIESIFVILFKAWELLPLVLLFIGFSIITHFWKISGHAFSVALATGIIISSFGWDWWPIVLCVPLVGWARVIRKDHTTGQVVAGALYAWTMLYAYEIGKSIF